MTAEGAFKYAPLHRHDPGYKNFLSEQPEKAELVEAFDAYEQWRAQQTVSTIAAAAIAISEGLDAALPATRPLTDFAQMSADLRAGTASQAAAMQMTQDARNKDREAQRVHDQAEAAANRLLERERLAEAAKEAERRHTQLLAMLNAGNGGSGAAAAAAAAPPPPPPPESSAPARFSSLEALLADANASAHADAFSQQEYTLTEVYAAFESNELMADLQGFIPAAGARRRIVTSVRQGPAAAP